MSIRFLFIVIIFSKFIHEFDAYKKNIFRKFKVFITNPIND